MVTIAIWNSQTGMHHSTMLDPFGSVQDNLLNFSPFLHISQVQADLHTDTATQTLQNRGVEVCYGGLETLASL